MLSDGEDQEEVIKVSNLVAKFENEIRKQTPNQRLIRTVRQVNTKESCDKRLNNALQLTEFRDNSL